MIAQITGKIVDKDLDHIVVDAGGVGYHIHVTMHDGEQAQLQQSVTLFTYHHIREQSQDLFGFQDKSAKELFVKLLSVKNVGPKVALAILDTAVVDVVRQAIAGGDVKLLQSAKGVGKRAAEQIVVELRDKVNIVVSENAEQIVSRRGINQQDEAFQALVSLGYSELDAQAALENIEQSLSVEEKIRKALQHGN